MSAKRAKFVIAGVVIAGSFLYLSIAGFQGDNLVYFMTVDEVAKKSASLEQKNQGVRVQGKIVSKTLTRNSAKMQIAFRLQGEATTLPVRFQGVPPDLLENGFPVIAEGKLNGEGVLVAKNLMVACPSKFEEKKKTGEAIPKEHEILMQKAQPQKQASVKK
ncbi:MAG: cytochrome c maturation protein CcmE [bacterium]|nr:cytochrome c maturation protein CcmE [bacterium]